MAETSVFGLEHSRLSSLSSLSATNQGSPDGSWARRSPSYAPSRSTSRASSSHIEASASASTPTFRPKQLLLIGSPRAADPTVQTRRHSAQSAPSSSSLLTFGPSHAPQSPSLGEELSRGWSQPCPHDPRGHGWSKAHREPPQMKAPPNRSIKQRRETTPQPVGPSSLARIREAGMLLQLTASELPPRQEERRPASPRASGAFKVSPLRCLQSRRRPPIIPTRRSSASIRPRQLLIPIRRR